MVVVTLGPWLENESKIGKTKRNTYSKHAYDLGRIIDWIVILTRRRERSNCVKYT